MIIMFNDFQLDGQVVDLVVLVVFQVLVKVLVCKLVVFCVCSCVVLEKEYKVLVQLGFVLYSYFYKEISLIIDVFLCDYGCIVLVVKGVKCFYFKLCGVLQIFQLFLLLWSGKFEVCMLIDVEWVGGLLLLEKLVLLCGFYFNELLVKLLVCEDVYLVLFDYYVVIFNKLVYGENVFIVLCQFECILLKQIGVVGNWSYCVVSGKIVQFDGIYVVDLEQGMCFECIFDCVFKVFGKMLLDMECEDYSDFIM